MAKVTEKEMKKATAIVLTAILVLSAVCLLVACGGDKEAVFDYDKINIEVKNYALGEKYDEADAVIEATLKDGSKRKLTKNLVFVDKAEKEENKLENALDEDGKFTKAGEYKMEVYMLEAREDLKIGEWTIKVA